MMKTLVSLFCVQTIVIQCVYSQISNGAIATSINSNPIANSNNGAAGYLAEPNVLNPSLSSQENTLGVKTPFSNRLGITNNGISNGINNGINNGIAYGGVNGLAKNNPGIPNSAASIKRFNGINNAALLNGVTNTGLSNGVNNGFNYNGVNNGLGYYNSLNNGIPAYGALSNGVNIPYNTINGNIPNGVPYSSVNGAFPSLDGKIPYSSPVKGPVAYSATGEGNMAINGELPVAGSTSIYGQVPVNGMVRFNGNVPAGGIVSVSGSCGCGFNGFN